MACFEGLLESHFLELVLFPLGPGFLFFLFLLIFSVLNAGSMLVIPLSPFLRSHRLSCVVLAASFLRKRLGKSKRVMSFLLLLQQEVLESLLSSSRNVLVVTLLVLVALISRYGRLVPHSFFLFFIMFQRRPVVSVLSTFSFVLNETFCCALHLFRQLSHKSVVELIHTSPLPTSL